MLSELGGWSITLIPLKKPSVVLVQRCAMHWYAPQAAPSQQSESLAQDHALHAELVQEYGQTDSPSQQSARDVDMVHVRPPPDRSLFKSTPMWPASDSVLIAVPQISWIRSTAPSTRVRYRL